MIVLKLKYHVKAMMLKIIYKIIYGDHFINGKSFSFRDGFHLMIESNGRVKIGNNVFFNNGCSLNAHSEITIGDNCIFGENVKVYDHNHKYSNENLPIFKQGFTVENIVIGDNCWIGSNVVILKGVTIGNNCVI